MADYAKGEHDCAQEQENFCSKCIEKESKKSIELEAALGRAVEALREAKEKMRQTLVIAGQKDEAWDVNKEIYLELNKWWNDSNNWAMDPLSQHSAEVWKAAMGVVEISKVVAMSWPIRSPERPLGLNSEDMKKLSLALEAFDRAVKGEK